MLALAPLSCNPHCGSQSKYEFSQLIQIQSVNYYCQLFSQKKKKINPLKFPIERQALIADVRFEIQTALSNYIFKLLSFFFPFFW